MWIGSTPTHRRILVIVGLALVAGILPAVVVAHAPTEGKREYTADNHHQFYSPGIWPGGIAAPSWVQTNVNSALNGDWDNTNVTRSPYFSLPVAGATEIATIYWATYAETPDSMECPGNIMWVACADYLTDGAASDRWKSTTLYRARVPIPSPLESYFCESPSQVGSTDGCFDTRRVVLHEAGHGVGMSRQSNGHVHFPDGGAADPRYSVMHSPPIPKPTNLYNLRVLGGCDLLSLAIDYDIDDFTDTYPGCGDHLGVPATQNGDIDTTATQSTASVVLCAGQSFSFTGTLKIVTASILGELSANGLAGRTVTIYRRTPSGSFVSYTTATVASGEGGAWSRSISSTLAATYVFQARYAPNTTDDAALDGDSSGVEKTVTWDNC